MKKSYAFLVIIVIAIIFLLWFSGRRPAPDKRDILANSSATQPPDSGKTNSSTPSGKQAQPQPPANNAEFVPDAVKEYVRKSMADPAYDWKQLINFYGRVVDESNAPVCGAGVHFTWNDTSEKGTSDADTKSDGNGFFSLTDRRGKRLYVDVGKEGYYSSGNSRGSAFEYANPADGLFTPDPNNRTTFHLRKKGVGVDLITSEYGVKPYFGVKVPLDGTPVQADLLERKAGQGPLTISQIKPEYKNWKQATNWSFRMEIPDGGFIEHKDEFPFTAPEEGYQSIVEFNFQQGQSGWVENLPEKNYYIKFGNPPRYGWLKLDTSIMMEGARFTYAINPDGSRNLEPKQ